MPEMNQPCEPRPRKTTTPTVGSETCWSINDDTAHFAEVIEKARVEGPQIITLDGVQVAMVVAVESKQEKPAPKESLVDFLLNSPLRGSEIDLERDRCETRDVEL